MRRTSNKRRRGAALMEAGLVMPVVLLFLFGIFEYGRYLMTLHSYNNAAREGVRYALANTQPITISGNTSANTDQAVKDALTKYLAGQQLTAQDIQVYKSDANGNNIGAWTGAKFGERICVKVTGQYEFAGPMMLLLPSSIPFTSKVVMRSEAN